MTNLELRGLKIAKKNPEKLNVNVETWADTDRNTWMCWGDFWVKYELVKAFRKLGCNASLGGVFPHHADLTVYLWGSKFITNHTWPFLYNQNSFNIAWFYSHPDKFGYQEAMKYDLILCGSQKYLPIAKQIAKRANIGISEHPLLACTSFKPARKQRDKPIDILFVGNARGETIKTNGRDCVRALNVEEETVVKIYGHKWHDKRRFGWLHEKKWYADQYWPYKKLNQLYGTSKIILVDGHEDMAREGFVPHKIFEVASCDAFIIANNNNGLKGIFEDSIVTYKDHDEMNRLIRLYLKNHALRDKMAKLAGGIARQHTFLDRAKVILSEYERNKDNRRAAR